MILFQNVSLFQAKAEILKNVSFECQRGKITSVIGRNGAGKTSVLKCLIREKPYTGQILLEGKDIRKLSISEQARRLAYLPQSLPDPSFTVLELVFLGRRPYQTRMGRMSEEDHECIERALILTDMKTFSERKVSTLSGGEKQRAYLSMVLAQNTDVIALDEAQAHMDPAVERELFGLLGKMTGEMGKTVIQVTHNLMRAVNDTDNIVLLDAGRVIAQMDKEEAKNSGLIEKIFSVKQGAVETADGNKSIVYM